MLDRVLGDWHTLHEYLGSKAGAGVFQAVIALMPPHDTYVELFAGTGAVLVRKPPAARSFAVDLNADVLALVPNEYPGLTKHQGDAFHFLDGYDYAAGGRTLIYADPRICIRRAPARSAIGTN